MEKISLTSDDQLSAMWHSKFNLARGTDDSKDYLNGAQDGYIKTTNKQLAWQNELHVTETDASIWRRNIWSSRSVPIRCTRKHREA